MITISVHIQVLQLKKLILIAEAAPTHKVYQIINSIFNTIFPTNANKHDISVYFDEKYQRAVGKDQISATDIPYFVKIEKNKYLSLLSTQAEIKSKTAEKKQSLVPLKKPIQVSPQRQKVQSNDQGGIPLKNLSQTRLNSNESPQKSPFVDNHVQQKQNLHIKNSPPVASKDDGCCCKIF